MIMGEYSASKVGKFYGVFCSLWFSPTLPAHPVLGVVAPLALAIVIVLVVVEVLFITSIIANAHPWSSYAILQLTINH